MVGQYKISNRARTRERETETISISIAPIHVIELFTKFRCLFSCTRHDTTVQVDQNYFSFHLSFVLRVRQ